MVFSTCITLLIVLICLGKVGESEQPMKRMLLMLRSYKVVLDIRQIENKNLCTPEIG